MGNPKVQITGWRCAAVKLALVPLFLSLGAMFVVLVPFIVIAGICTLPWLPVYRTTGFGISIGEGEGEGE